MKKYNVMRFLTALVLVCLLVSSAGTGVLAEGEPVITQDLPESFAAIAGQTVTLACQADGAASYQWYRNDIAINITGNTYAFSAELSMNGDRICCAAKNDAGETRTRDCVLSVIAPPSLVQDIPSSLVIEEGQNIVLSAQAQGENISCQWYTNTQVLSGQNSATLTIPATMELNGQGFYCQFVNPAGSVSTGLCYVTVTAAATPTPTASPSPTPSPTPGAVPTITKNPTGESVQVDGRAIFIARADNVSEYIWMAYNGSGGESYDYKNLKLRFPTLSVTGGDTDTLTLTRIPEEMDGWLLACRFKNEAGETVSEKALLRVTKAESKINIINAPRGITLAMDEKPEYTLSVQATATNGGSFAYQWYAGKSNKVQELKAIPGATKSSYKPERTEGTMYYRVNIRLSMDGTLTDTYDSDLVAVTFTATKTHEHAYSSVWDYNDISHWHQCTCGDHSDETFHDFTFTVITSPTADKDGEQKAVCTVCGFETVQTIPAGTQMEGEEGTPAAETEKAGKKASSSTILLIALIVAAAGVIAGAVFLIRKVLREDSEK